METLWRLLCRSAGTGALLTLALAALTPLPRWLQQRLLVAPGGGPADAIVVLGAAVSEDGLLDSPSLRRTLAGILAQRQGRADTLLLLGCRQGSAVEADLRATLARDLGLPPEVVQTEARGLTTLQEARYVASRLLPRGARRIVLVTGECHMGRAAAVFRRVGFDVAPLPVRELPLVSTRPQQGLQLLRQVTVEHIARALHRLAGDL